MKLLTASLLIVLFGAVACSQKDMQPKPPTAAKLPFEMITLGHTRVDNYYWMNERENPEVIAYLEAENTYTEAVMAHTKPLQDKLFEEIKARLVEEDESAPYRHGDYLYYRKQARTQDYAVYYRRKAAADSAEELLLDVNAIAEGHEYFQASGFTVSPDHKLAAYVTDTVGRRFFTLNILDLESGKVIDSGVSDITSNFVWAADNKTIYYVRQNPETLTYEKVHRHSIGGTKDELIYVEPDETYSVTVDKGLSGKVIYINSDSTVANEVRFIDAYDPECESKLIAARVRDHEYSVTDGGDRFFIRTNDNAENFKIMEASFDAYDRANWKPVVEHRPEVLVEDVTAFKDYLVIDERENGLTQLAVIDRNSGERVLVAFDEPAYTVGSTSNYEFDSPTLRYSYESFTRPESVYDYDFKLRESSLVKEEKVLGGFDANNYQAERFFVTARDGAKIPVEIVYRKGMKLDGTNPVWQYGYGSYGLIYDPSFSVSRLSMLDRGFIFAIAHIRGGSEMGRNWYFDGRQLNKKNTFTDFIDVTQYMIDVGYTSPQHMYAEGGSAGGLLMGAVVNMAPELYNGINAGVAFVDVVTTMLDDSIPLTALEWDEWGNPAEEKFYEYMLSYSPYDQVEARHYPNMLLTTGLHDSQVQYWEPAKWAAKLRELKTDKHILLLKTDMEAGHGGKAGRLQSLHDVAFEYAFFMDLEGIEG